MASPSLFLSLSFLFFFISTSSATKPTTITLSPNHLTKNPSSDPWEHLSNLASSSLNRAKHLKNPHKKKISTTPLSPQSYGGYSISLSFGTPPQTIPFIMDTGSDLVWFPCTQHYLCKNCTFSNPNIKSPIFLPKTSTSSKLIGCKNPKCNWIHSSNVQSRCKDCEPNSTICSQICPPYILLYGSATTGGILLSETLDLPNKRVSNFGVGCSIFASHSPSGIAGFGRGPASLPSQLGLHKFSYCLVSHRFDDSTQSSSLVLDGSLDSGDKKTKGVSYTPLVTPATVKQPFSTYYYVGLRKITVGEKTVKIPYSYLTQTPDGNGGTIVDSGSTFTFMEGRVFDLVVSEFEKQTTNYKRAADVELKSGLRPCYDISGEKHVSLPKLVLHFKGGADMELPLENYFSFIGDKNVVCMTIVTDGGKNVDLSGGPAVILGNFQLQNFYVEYDLKNQRFGFSQQRC